MIFWRGKQGGIGDRDEEGQETRRLPTMTLGEQGCRRNYNDHRPSDEYDQGEKKEPHQPENLLATVRRGLSVG